MVDQILDVLQDGRVLISDGALGTMLQGMGLPPGLMPELWNTENPEALRKVHRAYLDAGAQVLTANTFGANRLRLGAIGAADRAAELTRRGIALAREVAGSQAWIAASIGPTGEILEPYGSLTVSQAEDTYAEQVMAAYEAGADVLLLETHHTIEEACAAVRVAKSNTPLPVFCTFAFDARGRTMMGARPQNIATALEQAGVDAMGANCGDGPLAIVAALEGFRTATTLPLIAQSNAGVPQLGDEAGTVWDVTPDQMAAHAGAFVSLGARIVGGCCGTGPEHIARIAEALRAP
ncbi:MAG: homocysteine S-methyltransferase family protein [Anaerolineae bacterium]